MTRSLSHKSYEAESLADLEMNAPTISEMSATSITWKNWKPWIAALSAAAPCPAVPVDEPRTCEFLLFRSNAF